MTSVDQLHKDGDHRFVAIPTALTVVTFHCSSSNDSSDDTETTKYFDNFETGAIQFNIVADQAIQIIGVNGTDFTDAIPVLSNTLHGENWGSYTEIKIKTTTANTNISVRVR